MYELETKTSGSYGTFGPVTVRPLQNIRIVITQPVVLFAGTKPCSITDRIIAVRCWLMFLAGTRFSMFFVGGNLDDVCLRFYSSVFGSTLSSQIDPYVINQLA